MPPPIHAFLTRRRQKDLETKNEVKTPEPREGAVHEQVVVSPIFLSRKIFLSNTFIMRVF